MTASFSVVRAIGVPIEIVEDRLTKGIDQFVFARAVIVIKAFETSMSLRVTMADVEAETKRCR